MNNSNLFAALRAAFPADLERTAIETALVLGPAGEFAFVILGAGLVEGIASPAFTQTLASSRNFIARGT